METTITKVDAVKWTACMFSEWFDPRGRRLYGAEATNAAGRRFSYQRQVREKVVEAFYRRTLAAGWSPEQHFPLWHEVEPIYGSAAYESQRCEQRQADAEAEADRLP